MHSMPSKRVSTTGRYFAGSGSKRSVAPSVEMQVHVALQMHRAGEPNARRHDDAPAARRVTGRDRLAQCAAVQSSPGSAPKSVIGNRDGKFRRLDARENRRRSLAAGQFGVDQRRRPGR